MSADGKSLVTCIGVGNVGRAWAIAFARAGHPVLLYDSDDHRVRGQALPMIRRHLADLAEAGSLKKVRSKWRDESAAWPQ